MILAALAGGRTCIEGALFSRDTEIMADCLARLGYVVNLNRFEKSIEIESPGGQPPNSCAQLHVGNAGTAARFCGKCAKRLPDAGTFISILYDYHTVLVSIIPI